MPPIERLRLLRFWMAQSLRILLPPLAATADNVTMQAELPNAAATKPRRRLFQFSLRSLLVVVTLLCAAMAIVSSDASRQKSATERIKAATGWCFMIINWTRRFAHEPMIPFRRVPTG